MSKVINIVVSVLFVLLLVITTFGFGKDKDANDGANAKEEKTSQEEQGGRGLEGGRGFGSKRISDAEARYIDFNIRLKKLLTVDMYENVERIRKGDIKYLRSQDYGAFKGFVAALTNVSKNLEKMDSLDILLQTGQKVGIVKAFVAGLSNKDPRVRISCALVLHEMLQFLNNVKVPKYKGAIRDLIIKRHEYVYNSILLDMHPRVREVWYFETVDKRKYNTVDFATGALINKNVYKVIDQLDLLVIRNIALEKLKSGDIKAEDFKGRLNVRIFKSFSDKLAKEDVPPLVYLENANVILINSLKYKSNHVRSRAASLLVKMYYDPKTPNRIKHTINKAKKENKVLEAKFKDYVKRPA